MILDKLKEFGRAILFTGNKKRARPTVVVTSSNVTFSLVDSPKGSEVLSEDVHGVTLSKKEFTDEVWSTLLNKHKAIMAAKSSSVVTLDRKTLLHILESFESAAVVVEFAPRAVKLGESKKIITDSGEYVMTCNSERYCDVVRVRELRSPHNLNDANVACIVGVTSINSTYTKNKEDAASTIHRGRTHKETIKASILKNKQMRKRVSKHTARRKKSQQKQLQKRKEQ